MTLSKKMSLMSLRAFLILFIASVLTPCLLSSCGSKKKSARDIRREQIRNNAEAKRKELDTISGAYYGLLSRGEDKNQSVTLVLEIKDIPNSESGEVDSVMIPTLSGYLKFNYGIKQLAQTEEFISFALTAADFDPKSDKIDVTASNNLYGDLVLNLVKDKSGDFTGTWMTPSISDEGTLFLNRSNDAGGTASLTDYALYGLRGDYNGVVYWDSKSLYQHTTLTINTSLLPPDGLSISATSRMFFGDNGSTEYLSHDYPAVDFNPISGLISIKSEASEAYFVGYLSEGKISGDWYSSYSGRMGTFDCWAKNAPTIQGSFEQFDSLKGNYQGTLQNSNPNSNLPERFWVSLVTSRDMAAEDGIRITGSVRFYLGDFNSLEYVEKTLTSISFNFFTRELVASTEDSEYTLNVIVNSGLISGKLSNKGVGEIGSVEVSKQ